MMPILLCIRESSWNLIVTCFSFLWALQWPDFLRKFSCSVVLVREITAMVWLSFVRCVLGELKELSGSFIRQWWEEWQCSNIFFFQGQSFLSPFWSMPTLWHKIVSASSFKNTEQISFFYKKPVMHWNLSWIEFTLATRRTKTVPLFLCGARGRKCLHDTKGVP